MLRANESVAQRCHLAILRVDIERALDELVSQEDGMHASEVSDFGAFARLLDALTPWLDHLAIVGGWAYRLYPFHPVAGSPKKR